MLTRLLPTMTAIPLLATIADIHLATMVIKPTQIMATESNKSPAIPPILMDTQETDIINSENKAMEKLSEGFRG